MWSTEPFMFHGFTKKNIREQESLAGHEFGISQLNLQPIVYLYSLTASLKSFTDFIKKLYFFSVYTSRETVQWDRI